MISCFILHVEKIEGKKRTKPHSDNGFLQSYITKAIGREMAQVTFMSYNKLIEKFIDHCSRSLVSKGNHTVSSSIWNLVARVSFSKSCNCTIRFSECNFSFLKNSQVQINSKLNEKNRIVIST